MTLISHVRYHKKRNESDIKLNFQNLILLKITGTKASKSAFWVTFLLFQLFWEFLFESIEQEDQASHIQMKDM